MPPKTIYHDILKRYWGFDGFRPLQAEIIQSVGAGRDTLGLLPTGGGKSITFQVPALAKEGVCLVVTPLVALMNDQVENLKRKGIKAYAVHSGLTGGEILAAYDNCIYGGGKFIYLSPERLTTELFLSKLPHLNVNLLAIDEAHCISQWGYDFRPNYLNIALVREHLPGVPVLALTATATPGVVVDIQEKLRFKDKNVFQSSYERPNLAYVVRHAENKEEQLLRVLTSVPGTAIVYVRNRSKSRELAEFLQREGINATYFHAGLPRELKNQRQAAWKTGQCRVMVSTNAFGMGIDKPDVRVVVHVNAPDSLEAYFQEAGRAGRDGQKSYAVLLWSASDKTQLEKSLASTFPPVEIVKRVYEALGNFFQIAVGAGQDHVFDFNIGRFCAAYGFNAVTVVNCLKILQRAGYISFAEDVDIASRVKVLMNNLELYKFQIAHPELDPYIKTLLRSFTGLFTDYVNIDEEILASRLKGTSRDKFYQALLALSRARVIDYIPNRTTPLITFLQRREEPRHVHLPPEVYATRKEQHGKRIASVIEYATLRNVCRNTLLLNYFGQVNAPDCTQCDVCRDRTKEELSGKEFNEIANMINVKLMAGPMELKLLVNSIQASETKLLKVIRWLEDNNHIKEGNDGKLRLTAGN